MEWNQNSDFQAELCSNTSLYLPVVFKILLRILLLQQNWDRILFFLQNCVFTLTSVLNKSLLEKIIYLKISIFIMKKTIIVWIILIFLTKNNITVWLLLMLVIKNKIMIQMAHSQKRYNFCIEEVDKDRNYRHM